MIFKPAPSPFDVITVGDVFVDIVMTGFPAWPQPGEEAFATELFREVGGGAAITACGLARLGAYVGTLAMVGQSDGQWFTQRLKECGVSTELLRQHSTQPTATTVSVSTAQDRSFFTFNGANTGLMELLNDEPIRRKLCHAYNVHFACPIAPELLSELTDLLHASKCGVSIDVGWHPDWLTSEASWQALRKVDMFFPNEREAELMTGETDPESMPKKFDQAGFCTVGLKLGEAGSMALWDRRIFHCLPHAVTAVDTTGAGDSFNAGFIVGWLDNRTPQDCLRLANLCGALSTTDLGGVAGFPTFTQLDELMAEFQ